MYEFSIAFAVGTLAGYLLLEHRYPIRSLAFLPLGVALFLVGYAATLPAAIEPLVPALDNAPLLTVHVAMAMIAYGVLAISFAAAVALPRPGRGGSLRLAARPRDARCGGLSLGRHRLPDLRHMIVPGLLLGLDRLGSLLGLGPQGDLGARHLAHLRGLPARPQPARLGRAACGTHPRAGLRGRALHLLRQPLLQRPARLLGAVGLRRDWADR